VPPGSRPDLLDDLDQPAADQVRAQLHHLGQSAAEALFRQTRRGHGGVKRPGAGGGPHR
jgi:hypothetical protein